MNKGGARCFQTTQLLSRFSIYGLIFSALLFGTPVKAVFAQSHFLKRAYRTCKEIIPQLRFFKSSYEASEASHNTEITLRDYYLKVTSHMSDLDTAFSEATKSKDWKPFFSAASKCMDETRDMLRTAEAKSDPDLFALASRLKHHINLISVHPELSENISDKDENDLRHFKQKFNSLFFLDLATSEILSKKGLHSNPLLIASALENPLQMRAPFENDWIKKIERLSRLKDPKKIDHFFKSTKVKHGLKKISLKKLFGDQGVLIFKSSPELLAWWKILKRFGPLSKQNTQIKYVSTLGNTNGDLKLVIDPSAPSASHHFHEKWISDDLAFQKGISVILIWSITTMTFNLLFTAKEGILLTEINEEVDSLIAQIWPGVAKPEAHMSLNGPPELEDGGIVGMFSVQNMLADHRTYRFINEVLKSLGQ
jgi:hypothetical protein